MSPSKQRDQLMNEVRIQLIFLLDG